MPKVNLTERIYNSDKHEHIELFYSWNARPCGGKKGVKTKAPKKEQTDIISNTEKTIAFSTDSTSDAAAEALIKKQRSQQESLARTRRDMHRFLHTRLFGHHIRFLTLTYAVEPENEKQARKDLYSCMDRFSVCVGRKVRWMAVPEHGSENGRFHWHVLLNCHYVRNEAFQKEFWKKGFVKLERIKKKKGYTSTDSALHYMMKYISKDLEAGKAWRHRWFHSRDTKVLSITTGHRIAPSEFTAFVKHLEAIGFSCLRRDVWDDGEFGKCTRLHYVRPLPAGMGSRNVLSYFAQLKNLDCDFNYYGFAVSDRVQQLAAGECEDIPDFRSFLLSDTVKQMYYDKIQSAKRYRYLQDSYFKHLWLVWQPYRDECQKRGEYLPDIYPWLVNTGKIESFEKFLSDTSFFYVPECFGIKEF